jgi:hypothetical protein
MLQMIAAAVGAGLEVDALARHPQLALLRDHPRVQALRAGTSAGR